MWKSNVSINNGEGIVRDGIEFKRRKCKWKSRFRIGIFRMT